MERGAVKKYLITIFELCSFFAKYSISAMHATEQMLPQHAVIKLLDYQHGKCDTFSWCSIKIGEFKQYSCCTPCGCDSECQRRKDCCPDYNFSKYVDEKVYDNITLFKVHFLRWVNDTDNVYRRDEGGELSQTCLRSLVLKPEKFLADSQAYMMTARCSLTTNITQNYKCEMNELESIPWSISFADITPVFSSEHDMIFKNEYCATCNSITDLTRWRVTVVSICMQTVDVFIYNYINPLEILKQVNDKRKPFNIVFIPTDNVQQQIYKHNCTKVDVDGCQDPEADEITKSTCAQLSSPIMHRQSFLSNTYWTVYNNAACLQDNCNKPEIFDTCTARDLHHTRRSEATLNIPPSMYYIPLNETDSFNDLLSLTLHSGVFKCGEGRVHDKSKNICRKLFCPKELFAMDGVCHSMFNEIRGVKFIVYLKLKPRVSLQSIDDLDTFTVLLYEEVVRIVKEYGQLLNVDTSLWRGRHDFFVYLTIDETTAIISDVTQFVQNIEKKQYDVNLQSKRIISDLTLDTSSRLEFRTIFDTQTKEMYGVQQPVGWVYPRVAVQYRILEINFCYRVELFREEYILYYLNNQDVIKIKANGVFVYDFSFKGYWNDSSVFVCMRHVFPEAGQIESIQVDDPYIDRESDHEPWFLNVSNILPVCLIGITAVVLIVGYVIKRRMLSRQIQIIRQNSRGQRN